MNRKVLSGIVLLAAMYSLLGMQLIAQNIETMPISILPVQSTAIVGVEYKYQVPVPARKDSGIVIFKLLRSPMGMTMDSMTGIVKWIPTVKGFFGVEVRITSSSHKSSSVAWSIQVVNFLGVITGIVKNENSEFLKGILVSVYRKSDKSILTTYTTQLSASTDSVGLYRIVIADSGEFYIQARSGPSPLVMSPFKINGTYIPLWYKDSPTMAGANPVLVKDATPIIANFTLKKYQQPLPVSISGTVSDGNGKPISGATVVASLFLSTASNSVSSLTSSFQEPGFGLFCNVGGKEKTDSVGHYKLSVLTGSAYVVASYKTGYPLQYYNNKSNVLEADKLSLKSDTTGINFKLTALSVATAKVSGVVVDSAGSFVLARVILYPVPSSPKTAGAPAPVVRTIHTDSLGVFTFPAVASGRYALQVVPFGTYLPAYFKATECGVREAKAADTIVVKTNQNVEGLVVCVKKIVAQGGGSITGWVKNSLGSGLSGVIVTAESQNSCSYGITENDGAYEIDDVDIGAYAVTTDKVGFAASVSTAPMIDYSVGVFTSQANFIVTEQKTTSVERLNNEGPEQFALYRNYPNPFNPSTQITFTLPSDGHARIRVFNILGQVVATLMDGYTTAGTHVVSFEAGNVMSSGVYIYELQYKDRIAINKMVLMK